MHADSAPAAPADRPFVAVPGAPDGASHGTTLVTLPQQIVLHAGARLVVVDSWRLATAELLRDGAVQRLGQARAAGDARIVVRFDRIAEDLLELDDRRARDATLPIPARRELPASVATAPSSLWRQTLAPHPHAALTAAALRQMQRAPGAPHRLVEIGATLGVSPYHVAHVFREQTGLSVHRYLLRLRLAIALDLLAGGVTNLSALALDLGFSSHSHFSSVFRRNTGLSPTGVRATFLARSDARAGLRAPLRTTLAS
jgi:AraC-like DNA-binding protein